jgi:hypothetical protein
MTPGRAVNWGDSDEPWFFAGLARLASQPPRAESQGCLNRKTQPAWPDESARRGVGPAGGRPRIT